MLNESRENGFPKNITLSLQSAGGQLGKGSSPRPFTVVEGQNEICKTANGIISINSSRYTVPTPSQQEYADDPAVLARIEAHLVEIETVPYLQLELEAVTSFLSIHRISGPAIPLSPQSTTSNRKVVSCLGDGDVIRFISSNASVTVSVPQEEVQVGSSVPVEASVPHSSKPSASFDKVAETPTAQRVQLFSPDSTLHFSTALQNTGHDAPMPDAPMLRANGDIDAPYFDRDGHTSMNEEVGTAKLAGLEGHDDDPTESEAEAEEGAQDDEEDDSHFASGVVTQTTRKRPADNKTTPRPIKKARAVSTPAPVVSPDEDFTDELPQKRGRDRPKKGTPASSNSPQNGAIEKRSIPSEPSTKRSRGRPKKDGSEGTSTPQVQTLSPSVVVQVDMKTRKDDTPSSSAANGNAMAGADGFDASSIQGTKPSVVFSGCKFPELGHLVKVFEEFAIIEATVTDKTDFLCIGKEGIKTTPKLLSAVARGKVILSEVWATKCATAKRLIDHHPFIARDIFKEKEDDLPSDWSSGTPRTDLLSEHEVYITPALRRDYGKGYSAVKELLDILGAKKVSSVPARDVTKETDKKLSEDTVILGLAHKDLDAIALHEHGYACYKKDLLANSILRGELSLDEHKFVPVDGTTKSKGRKSMG